VARARNQLEAHLWDQSRVCLPPGSTSLHVRGHHQADLPLDDLPPGRPPGRWVLLSTAPTSPAIPIRRWRVRLVDVVEELDPLPFPAGQAVTRLTWEPAQATPFELDL